VTGGSGADSQAITARSGCHIGTVSATSVCSLRALNVSGTVFQRTGFFSTSFIIFKFF